MNSAWVICRALSPDGREYFTGERCGSRNWSSEIDAAIRYARERDAKTAKAAERFAFAVEVIAIEASDDAPKAASKVEIVEFEDGTAPEHAEHRIDLLAICSCGKMLRLAMRE